MAEKKFTTKAAERKVDPAATSACGGDVEATPVTGEMAVALQEKPPETLDDLSALAAGENSTVVEAAIAEVGPEDDATNLLMGVDLGSDLSDEDRDLLESPNFDVQTDDYSNLEEPHWLFDTQALFDRIKALVIVVKDRQELVSKTVWLKPGQGYVTFRVNTGEIFAEVKVDVLNPTHFMERDFVLDWKQFFATVKNSGAKFLLMEKNGTPTVTVLGGDVPFESYQLQRDIFNHPACADDTGFTTIEGALFSRFLLRAQYSMALASRPEDRVVRIQDNIGLSSFLSCIYIQRQLQLNNVSFRAADLSFLNRMFEGASEIRFKETEKDYIFATIWAKVAMPKIDTSALAPVMGIINSVKTKWEFSISPLHLYKVTTLLKSMVGNTGTLRCSQSNGQFMIDARTRTSKELSFRVAAAPEEAEFSVTVPVASITSTANMFRKEPVANVSIDQEGRMIFSSEGVEVIFGSMGS